MTNTPHDSSSSPWRHSLRLPLLALLALMAAGRVTAQTAGGATPPPPKCDSPDHRAFDFWLGDWNVTVGGQQAGTNLITREQDGCILHEHWVGSRGGTGQSFNFFDRATGKWHQVWVDNSGMVARFTGTFREGALHYESDQRAGAGGNASRMTFTPNPDGTVRQLWETTTDGGKSWAVAFDGLYRKKGG